MEYPKNMPFEWVVEELESMNPIVGRMFGCFSIYVEEKIVLILRDRPDSPEDNGVWIATTVDHHASLLKDLPSIRSIELFGPGPTGWQVIPFESDDFDRDVLKVCQLIRKRDPRVGKIPVRKKKSDSKKKSQTKIKAKTKTKTKSSQKSTLKKKRP